MLAAVTVGCYVGWQAPRIASPATRLKGFGMWELLQFLLNAFLFVLIGLQLPSILDALDGPSWTHAARLRARRSAPRSCSRGSRGATRSCSSIRALDRARAQRARRSNWQART